MKRFKDFINEAFTVYDGDFKVTEEMVLHGKLIKNKIPYHVTGDFDCSDLGLTTLDGCPSFVGGLFMCTDNLITNFKDAPLDVRGGFYAVRNKLTSLEGISQNIGEYLDLHDNELMSLEGCPEEIKGYFACYKNKLKTLKGGPLTVRGRYDCSDNMLTSLEYGPCFISDIIDAINNSENLLLESGFIKSGGNLLVDERYGKKYYSNLLKYLIKYKIDLKHIKTWPKGFLNDNLIQSVQGINKYNL